QNGIEQNVVRHSKATTNSCLALAVGEAETRRPIVLVDPRGSRNAGCLNRWIRRSKKSQRDSGVLVPESCIDGEISCELDIVLKKVRTVPLPCIERGFVDGLCQAGGVVVQEIRQT